MTAANEQDWNAKVWAERYATALGGDTDPSAGGGQPSVGSAAGPAAANRQELATVDVESPEYLLREEREWILVLGAREDAVRAAVAYAKQIEGHPDDYPWWVDDLEALADDLRDGTAETKEQLREADA